MKLITWAAANLALGLASAWANAPNIDREVIREHWAEGAQKFQDGDVFGALDAWQMALRLDPDNEAIRDKVDMVRAGLTAVAVTAILSGDTIQVRLDGQETTVKLLGVVAPDGGPDASSALASLLREQSVYLKTDPDQAAPKPGEALAAYVYRAPNGPFVNLDALRQGHVKADRDHPHALLQSFLQAEHVARGARRGVWRDQGAALPGTGPPPAAAAMAEPPPPPGPPEPQPIGENLVLNAALEEDVPADALPRGWALFTAPGGKYLTRLATPGHQSTNCWSIEGRGEYGAVLAARVRAEPERRYVGGGWAKVVGPGQAVIKVDYYQGTNLIGSELAGVVRAAPDWQEVRLRHRTLPPPAATRVGLALVLVGDGAAFFDDVRLQAEKAPAEPDLNLLVNGHLESGVGAQPWAFTLYGYPNEQPWWRWSTEGARTGDRGLQLKGDTTYVILAHDAVLLEPDKGYELRGWVRARSGEAVLKFDFLDAEFEWLGQETSRAAPADGQWHELTLKADLTHYGQAKHLTVSAFAMEPGTDADFDDLGLYQTGPR